MSLREVLEALAVALPARMEVRERMGTPSRYVWLDRRWQCIGPMAFVTANGACLLEHALREEVEARKWELRMWQGEVFDPATEDITMMYEAWLPTRGKPVRVDSNMTEALAGALAQAVAGEGG